MGEVDHNLTTRKHEEAYTYLLVSLHWRHMATQITDNLAYVQLLAEANNEESTKY